MKFVYSLQSILEYRQQLEDIKKEKFIELSTILNNETTKLEAMKNELEKAVKESAERKNYSVAEQKNYMNFIVHLEKKIERQRQKIKDVERKRERSREELEEAVKERKIMESLGEKELEKYLLEFKRREEKELNEVAVISYVRQRKIR